MINPEEDGITHINIYSKARTELGKLLSNWARIPFTHPEDGYFTSIEGYWYWLKLEGNPQREILRNMWGWEAKDTGRKMSSDKTPLPVAAREKIKEAIRLKVANSPKLQELLRANTLPFKHYYVYGGLVREPSTDKWLVEFIETLEH